MDKENQTLNEQELESWDSELEDEEAIDEKVNEVDDKLDQCKIDDTETADENGDDGTKENNVMEVREAKKKTRKEQRQERKLNEAVGFDSAEGSSKSKSTKKKEVESTEVKEDELFIHNFGESVDENELLNQFNQFGTITKAHVARDFLGKSRRFGFVCFETPEEANRAMSEMNRKKIGGKKVTITFVQVKLRQREPKKTGSKKEYIQEQGPAILKENELHISNLEDWVDNHELMEEFKRFGTIREARVVRDKTDRSKGFAFLCFETNEEAKRALSKMNGYKIGEKAISIALVEQKPGQQGCNPKEADKKYKKDRIFVKNLDGSVTEEELKSIFIQFGNIIDVRIHQFEDTGKSRGYIQFFSYKAAEKAIIEMNGRMIKENPVFVLHAEIIPGKTRPMKPKPAPPLPLKKDNIFISNLPKEVTASKLKDLFSRFGSIVKVKIVPEQHIAFIQFVLKKDAQQAVNLMDGYLFESKQLRVTLANHKGGKSYDPFNMAKKPSEDPLFKSKKPRNRALYEDMY